MTRTRLRQILLAGMTLTLGVPSSAFAQQTIAPKQLFRGTVERDAPWLALLREANMQGSQEKLLSVVTEFLADLSKAEEISDPLAKASQPVGCCDQRRYVFQVAFLQSEAADAPLVRLFVHRNGLTRGVLPGIHGAEEPLFDVFLAEALSVRLDTVYQSEPVEDPLAEQSAGFVKLVLGKLALPIGLETITTRVTRVMGVETRGTENQRMRSTRPPLAVTLSRVDLPSRRAKVTISHSVFVTDPAEQIRAQAHWVADTALRRAIVSAALGDVPPDTPEFEAEVRAGQAAYASCSLMAAGISDGAVKALEGAECSPLKADPASCFRIVEDAIAQAYESAAGQPGSCPAGDAFPLVRRFLSIVPPKLSPAQGSVVVMNAPKTRWSFGLSTAFIAAIETDNEKPRTKISGGRIVVDPFHRVLAMGVVNFTPAGFDPESVQLTARERFRLFGGVAFAPHFGATGGVAWSFNRYLGANVGYALLVYDTPKPGEAVDSEPSAGNRAAPFDLASTHALFAGFTFNLK